MRGGPMRTVGRYLLGEPIGSGGMATVHFGRLTGAAGFERNVAIKRLHPHLAAEPDSVAMLLDEARTSSRIQHPNVVQTLDVVSQDGELFLVMEYVHGESLAKLLRRLRPGRATVPLPIASAIALDALRGLHCAHEATDAEGVSLGIVHRDVSPHNLLVGADGYTRVLDFGVAKAMGRLQTTRDGALKGKIAFMAPEQLLRKRVDRRADVYAMGVVLWEVLTGARLFDSDSEGGLVREILEASPPRPGARVHGLPARLDDLVIRALAREPSARFESAAAMADALEACVAPAPVAQVAAWLEHTAGESLRARAAVIAEASRAPAAGPGALAADEAPSLVTPTPHVPPRPSRRARAALAGAAACLVVAAALGVALQRRAVAGRQAEGARAAATAALAMATASAAPTQAPSAPGQDTASPAPPLVPDVAPVQAADVTGAARGGVRAGARPAAPRASGCSPPYVVAADGHHIYKRRCLQ